MAIDFSAAFPRQNLPYKSKGDKWRRDCIDWCSSRTYFHYAPVRETTVKMKINYDLLNGIIHMEDVARIINPDNLAMSFIADKIQHYPIINSKLNTLRGEEAARVFDWRVIVTNPNSISKIEEDKDGNRTITFYELDESRVQYVHENLPEIADEIRDSEPASLPWGTPDNPRNASYYYVAVRHYEEHQAVFDKAFFGITANARCNQDLDIHSQRTYKIRGLLSYHSKDLTTSFFLRSLRHIWDVDGNWTELEFIR